MNSFLSMFILAATAAASFVPQDTPAVAHAKAQHLAIVEQTKLRNALGATHINVHHSAPSHGWYASGWNHGWAGAVPAVVNGHVQDTPDVAEAKAKHLQILAAETARNSAPLGHYGGVWNVAGGVHASASAHAEPWHPSEGYLRYGPAHIVVIDGQVQDTPEVAYAKHKHIAALHEVETSHSAW